jgi:hypothetical protein
MSGHEVEVAGDAAALTAPWLTSALRAGGHDVTVTDVRVTPVGTGQMGASYRLAFDATGADGGLPATLVAKLPAPDPGRRAMAAPGYRAELTFYEHVAPTIAARIPACLLAVASEDWHDFTLLMEDVAPASQGDQLAGCSLDDVMVAATNLAGVHGPRWSDPTLWDIPHLDPVGPADVEFLAAVFADALGSFTTRFVGALDDADRAVLDAVGPVLSPFLLGRADRFAVLHGDYRLDNLLFAPDRRTVVTVDWQTMTIGLPGRDLAYLVATSLDPAERRAGEHAVVAAYHRALEDHGVTGYDLATCFEDYRVGMLQCPLIIVLGAAYGDQTERGDAMFTVMLRRSLEAMRDLGSLDAV